MVGETLEDRVFCSVTEYNEFAYKIAKFTQFSHDIDNVLIQEVFSGGEFCPRFTTDLTNKSVYIVATPDLELSPQELTMRICLVADAAKEKGAKKVILVQPDLSYARQDRPPCMQRDGKMDGQPYSALVQARNFKANGVNQVLTMHIHSLRNYRAFGEAYGEHRGSELGTELRTMYGLVHELADHEKHAFQQEIALREGELEALGRGVLINLDPNPALAHYLRFRSSLQVQNDGENIVFIAPDAGAKHNIDKLKELCFLPNASIAYCSKVREVPNTPDALTVELDGMSKNYTGLRGKSVIIADDIVDTGGTITKTIRGLMNSHQVPDALYLCFTHPVLAGRNYNQIQNKLLSLRDKGMSTYEIITFNTHPFVEEPKHPKWREVATVLRIAGYMSDAIRGCMAQGRTPQDFYHVSSLDELEQKFKKLYDVKRSTIHFLNNGLL